MADYIVDDVLWKQVRFQGMPEEQAEQLLRDLLALPIKIVPVRAVYGRALRIGVSQALAIYDSVYIALAERMQLPLVTTDNAQTRAATVEGIEVKDVTDFKI